MLLFPTCSSWVVVLLSSFNLGVVVFPPPWTDGGEDFWPILRRHSRGDVAVSEPFNVEFGDVWNWAGFVCDATHTVREEVRTAGAGWNMRRWTMWGAIEHTVRNSVCRDSPMGRGHHGTLANLRSLDDF